MAIQWVAAVAINAPTRGGQSVSWANSVRFIRLRKGFEKWLPNKPSENNKPNIISRNIPVRLIWYTEINLNWNK